MIIRKTKHMSSFLEASWYWNYLYKYGNIGAGIAEHFYLLILLLLLFRRLRYVPSTWQRMCFVYLCVCLCVPYANWNILHFRTMNFVRRTTGYLKRLHSECCVCYVYAAQAVPTALSPLLLFLLSPSNLLMRLASMSLSSRTTSAILMFALMTMIFALISFCPMLSD